MGDSECSSTHSHGVTPQARRKFFDLNKCQIDPAALRIHDDTNIAGAFREIQPVRAFLHRAPVHLHPRAQELAQHEATKAIVHEVKTLLRCLHPNVLCLFGFVYDLHGGTALVMEPAWDSVAAALHSGSVSALSATQISAQVISALRFMHSRRISMDLLVSITSPCSSPPFGSRRQPSSRISRTPGRASATKPSRSTSTRSAF